MMGWIWGLPTALGLDISFIKRDNEDDKMHRR